MDFVSHREVRYRIALGSMEFHQLKALLKNNEVFRALSDEELEHLAAHASFVGVEKSTRVFHQGEKGRGFYVLASGKLSLHQETTDGLLHIRDVHPGEFVGEMTLFQERGRWATVLADEGSSMFLLDRDEVRKVLARNSEARDRMDALIRKRIASEPNLGEEDVEKRIGYVLPPGE
jgi:CRP/FNR family transcriptional regulator